MWIDMEKVVWGTVLTVMLVAVALLFGGAVRTEAPASPPAAEVALTCEVRASHPATDGGRILTLHCPPEVAP